MLAAPILAEQFSSEAGVQKELIRYLRVIPIGYAFIGSVAICSSAFNAVDRATRSSVLSVLRSLVLAIPAAMMGNEFAGLTGLFSGLVLASGVSAILGILWMRSFISPYGSKPSGAKPMSESEVHAWVANSPSWRPLKDSLPTILNMDGIKPHRIRGRALGLHIGAIELVHLDQSGKLDLPMPVEIGENLVRLGILDAHPVMDNNGWYRLTLSEQVPTDTAMWVIGLAHLLYGLSERGEDDPITKAEMDAYTRTPRCVEAMRAAAIRWNAAGEYTGNPQ
jgi:hypothetical protein